MNKPRFTIAIPTHGMEGREFFLRRTLDALWNQTLQDFEIVVTDNSEDEIIETICNYYGSIRYFRNPIKGMAQNTNEAIRRSQGELIKILYLDDYLAHNEVLEKIWRNFKGNWLVTGCEHNDGTGRRNPHIPDYSGINAGINTIGSPSILTIKNDHPLLFDETMTWLLDVDYYRGLHELYGEPVILKDICTIMGLGSHQMTNILSDELKAKEYDYLIQKHA